MACTVDCRYLDTLFASKKILRFFTLSGAFLFHVLYVTIQSKAMKPKIISYLTINNRKHLPFLGRRIYDS
jgi:hypothetical protein